MGDSCNGEEETEPSQVISVDVEQGDKETESNENEIDNSNKWEHESPNGPPSLKEASAREAELTNSPLFSMVKVRMMMMMFMMMMMMIFSMVKASIASLDSAEVDRIAPGLASNPANVKRVESIMTSEQWDYLFAVRDPDYTYRR